MPNRLALDLARELRRKLEVALPDRVRDVRVYGSQARGDAHEESDLDVFVLLDRKDMHAVETIARLAFDVWNAVDGAPLLVPLIRSVDEFDEMVRRERRLALDILEQGVSV